MPLSTSSIEPEIRRIGEQLARLSAGRPPTLFDRRWWSHTIINHSIHDSAFKTQLFRFIDVLPSVRDDATILSLAQEHLGDVSAQLFGLQWGMSLAASTTMGARLTGKAIRHQVEQMARSFIAGGSLHDAMPVLADLWAHGRCWSVDLLGEATISHSEADRYRDRYLEALEALRKAADAWPSNPVLERDLLGLIPRVQLSMKISALSPSLDPIDPEACYRFVAARLRPIVDLAMSLQASLIFDMEQAEIKDVLLAIYKELCSEPAYRSYPHFGLALQAYHRDTRQDVEDLLQWARRRQVPMTIRLVKGAYWDSDTIRYRQRGWPVPLFEEKAETDLNYEALALTLLQQTAIVRPAFGTHNLRTLAAIEAMAESLKLPPEVWEYQMIFGMAEPFQQAITQYGRRLRLYTPIGDLLPGMAYLVRRLLENTSNESFLMKEYVESQPLAQLLAAPRLLDHPSESPNVSHSAAPAGFQNEPVRNFSDATQRAAMTGAVDMVRAQLGRQWDGSSGAFRLTGPLLQSYNPSRPDEVVGIVASASLSDVQQAVQRAVAAWQSWRETSAEHRAGILRAAAASLRIRRDEFAAWEIFECGKPWREADADVVEAIDFLEFYAAEWLRLASPRRLGQAPGELNRRWYHPRGVTVVIAPWNFPLAIPAGMIAAAVVTGNPVLFKPSERSPVVGHLLTDLFRAAGLPDGALCCLAGGPEIGRALVQQPAVATIVFTGSKDVGLDIIETAARPKSNQMAVPRVIAEMGGKNAIIVDESADLDEAIAGVVASFTGYAGQKCSACSRAIVQASVYEPFLARLKEAVLSLVVGDADKPGTQVGPVIDARAQAKIRDYIALGKRELRLVVEQTVPAAGWFVGPTVFADVPPTHRLAQEEIFGPVLVVMPAASFEEALDLANATPYALTGGVYSRSPKHVALAEQRFDVGNLYVNRLITGALVSRQPFGGHRFSGVGAKTGGEDYLAQFVTTRVVSENTLRRGFAPAE